MIEFISFIEASWEGICRHLRLHHEIVLNFCESEASTSAKNVVKGSWFSSLYIADIQMFSARGFQAHETLSEKASGKRISHCAHRNCSMFLRSPKNIQKTSEKMPGNLGLAMKELDAAEVRAVIFFGVF